MEGKCWENARNEFLSALKVRARDRRWAVMTYGMHRIPEYFPNRELGITYYHLNDIKNALKYLLISYDQCVSAKAIYYINRIRREQLIITKEDKESPRLLLKKINSITCQNTLAISGVALDDTYVAEITIEVNNEEPLSLLELSHPIKKDFEQRIFINPGINEVLIKVYDLLGKGKATRIYILVDQEGPLIYFAAPKEEDYKSSGYIEGIICDHSDIGHFSLNGNKVSLTKIETLKDPNSNIQLQAYYFNHPIFFNKMEEGILYYQANDSFNNSVSGTITLKGKQEKQASIRYSEYIQLALTDQTVTTDFTANSSFYQVAKMTTPDPVKIDVTHCPKETFQKEISPQIEIYSSSHIQQIYINNKPVFLLHGLKWNKILFSEIKKYLKGEKEERIVFPRMIELKVGKNPITVHIEDKFGVIWEKAISVIRKERQIDNIKERWRMVIPYIVSKKGRNIKKEERLTYKLFKAFTEQKRFNIIDRKSIPFIIKEKRLIAFLEKPYLGLPQESDIWIDVILLGYVNENRDSFTLSASLVDLETGEILAEKDVFEKIDPKYSFKKDIKDKTWEHVYKNCCILASRFKEHFPRSQGGVISINEKDIRTSITNKDGLKTGMKLILYENREKEEDYTIIGEAKVKEVSEVNSLAEIYEDAGIKDNNKNFIIKLRAITR